MDIEPGSASGISSRSNSPPHREVPRRTRRAVDNPQDNDQPPAPPRLSRARRRSAEDQDLSCSAIMTSKCGRIRGTPPPGHGPKRHPAKAVEVTIELELLRQDRLAQERATAQPTLRRACCLSLVAGLNRLPLQEVGSDAQADARMRRRQGTILIVTIWVVLRTSWPPGPRLAGRCEWRYVLGQRFLPRSKAGRRGAGAIQYVLAHVDSLKGAAPTRCGHALRIGTASARRVLDHPARTSTTRQVRAMAWRTNDEASKVHLNTARYDAVQAASMTAELSACLIDWRTAGAMPTRAGQERVLPDAARPVQLQVRAVGNVEELFLVKGYQGDSLRRGPQSQRILDHRPRTPAATAS